MKAILKNYKQSPRKVRPIINKIRRKKIAESLFILKGMDKKAAIPLQKLIMSAVANGGDKINIEKNIIETIVVEDGRKLKRRVDTGAKRVKKRIFPIVRRYSTVKLELK